jgi:dTMP kinase
VKARFITLEGGEGAGKTTNLAFIEQHLKQRGVDVLRTREPGGTPLGEDLRVLLLREGEVCAMAELLMVFAARAQHVEQVIRPALAAGRWVLSDRFTDASYAYQGGGRGVPLDRIGSLETWIQQGLAPDLTLFLDLPLEIGMARARARGASDRFESEEMSFFSKVQAAYRARALHAPERIKSINASGAIEVVQQAIARELDALIARS